MGFRASFIQCVFLAAALPALVAQPAKMRAGDWPMYNRDLAGTRYSPLTQINPGNVAKLTKDKIKRSVGKRCLIHHTHRT